MADENAEMGESIRLLLCGDVMTGRGIDQILPHPGDPRLYEPCVASAVDYVRLAERRCGPIARPVSPAYVWGDALAVLARMRPTLRLVNLETAVTARGAPWPGKHIHYRMHPANVGVLQAFAPDCCTLANNHVLDWGRPGLRDTVDALRAAGIATTGAGSARSQATAPVCLTTPVAPHGGTEDGTRVLVFGFAAASSGVPRRWAATASRAGVAWLADVDEAAATTVLRAVEAWRKPGDLVVVSIHWGPNWGYEVTPAERAFAHRLVDGGVDLVHGHSSHHPRPIEVYRERLVLYGCGDFLNDYEGIGGYEHFRPDLALMYFPCLHVGSGRLLALTAVPTRIAHLRVNLATAEEGAWLQAALSREGRAFGTALERDGSSLRLRWG